MSTAQPPMMPFVIVGAEVMTIWGLEPPFKVWALEAFVTPPTGPPRLPPAQVKLTVDWTELPRVRLARVRTDEEPEAALSANRRLLMVLAPPLIVTAPRVCASDSDPAMKESVPPVRETAPEPIREPATTPRPLLSKVSWPNGTLMVPAVVTVAASRKMRAPPRTVSEPFPRLAGVRSVRLLEPCLAKLMLPPEIAPAKVFAVLSWTTSNVAAEAEEFVTVPAPLA